MADQLKMLKLNVQTYTGLLITRMYDSILSEKKTKTCKVVMSFGLTWQVLGSTIYRTQLQLDIKC